MRLELLAVFLLFAADGFQKSSAGFVPVLPCLPCLTLEECERPPMDLCVFGEARDACNRKVCAKGPGERCGGPNKILGECGEGLRCFSDERCHGCSMDTMICSKS